VTAVPVETSRTILEVEVVGARAWAERRGWSLALGSGLQLDVRMLHPADHGPLLLRGEFDGYRALPPTWLFLDPDAGDMTPRAWPAAGPVGGQASIFHSVGVICANFSRRAYTDVGGPHAWGGLTKWTRVTEGIHAENVGEMLSAVEMHLRYSPGRMG
jgi:hypothetical protein